MDRMTEDEAWADLLADRAERDRCRRWVEWSRSPEGRAAAAAQEAAEARAFEASGSVSDISWGM